MISLNWNENIRSPCPVSSLNEALLRVVRNQDVFGVSFSLPTFVDKGGRLAWSADEKASLFSAHFDDKQCRDGFQQLHSCDPSPVLCSVAFWSSSIRSFFLDLNSNSGNDLDGMFPLFYKQVAQELAPSWLLFSGTWLRGVVFWHAALVS